MHIDYKTLIRLLPIALKARKPIMLRGKHGIGKSEVVYQLAEHLASIMDLKDKNYIYPVVERRASQMADAGDIMGLPQLDGVVTQFLPMKWFYQACEYPCILFLDELDRGCTDVRQAIFELADSRKIAGHSLHPDTVVIACCNGGHGENQYQVGEMDPAELNRWTVFEFKPTVNEWIEYAQGKVEQKIVDFINANNTFLEHTQGEFESNKVYPSRRSWFRLNEAIKNTNLLEEANVDLLYIANAFLGQEAATSLRDYCANYNSLLSPEDIINKGQWKKTQKPHKWDINQHMTLIAKMQEHENLKKKMTEKQMTNLSNYLFCIPGELVMQLWQLIATTNNENGIALFSMVVDGRSVSSYISELNGIK